MHDVGTLLAYWRGVRRLSQLALATEAEVSPRHLSFIESGRAKPSRDMVLLLARALDVPLRERNTLLEAAGFAAAYRASELGAPQLAAVEAALDAILEQHRPYPAVVLDRAWNITRTNDAADELFGFLLDGDPPAAPNVLRLVFGRLKPWIANWDELAGALIQRVHRESIGHAITPDLRALLDEVLAYPGIPPRWTQPDLTAHLLPIIPVRFEREDRRFAYFSTVTTLGTPIDVTAQELRIECFFPLDDATRREVSASAPRAPRPASRGARASRSTSRSH